MKKIIILCGLPNSGKTMAGQYFEMQHKIPFLRTTQRRNVINFQSPWAFPQNYEEKVMNEELENDKTIDQYCHQKYMVVIEGWHLHNYAFALTRNSKSIKIYDTIINDLLNKYDIKIIYFSKTPDESVDERYKGLNIEQRNKLINWYQEWLGNLDKSMFLFSEISNIKTAYLDMLDLNNSRFYQRLNYILNLYS